MFDESVKRFGPTLSAILKLVKKVQISASVKKIKGRGRKEKLNEKQKQFFKVD